MSFNDIVAVLTSEIKKMGYKKNKLTWYKEKDRLTVVFSIQKSQWGQDVWYYCFGICLHDIATGNRSTMAQCQIRYRVDSIVENTLLPAEGVVRLLNLWENKYGELDLLRVQAIQGELPLQMQRDSIAISYLTTVNLAPFKGDGSLVPFCIDEND